MTQKQAIAYKFIVYSIRDCSIDTIGRRSYMDEFDRVMRDLYGFKNLSNKISELYDDRDIIAVIDRIGAKQLLDLFKNPKYVQIIKDLVQIVGDLRKLAKEIQKDRKKGRTPDPQTVKEYNYLRKIYNKGIKVLIKRLKIKSARTSYKSRYTHLNDLLSETKRRGFWDPDSGNLSSFIDDDSLFRGLGGLSFIDEDDDLDDRGDDFEETNLFQDFERAILNDEASRTPSSRSRRRRSREESELEYFLDDEFKIGAEDEDEDPDDFEETKDAIKSLTNTVSVLADSVNAMRQRSSYADIENRPRPVLRPSDIASGMYVPDDDDGEVEDMRNDIDILVEAVANMRDQQKVITQYLIEKDAEEKTQRETVSARPPEQTNASPAVIDGEDIVAQLNATQPPKTAKTAEEDK